jgi:hypothetical protein
LPAGHLEDVDDELGAAVVGDRPATSDLIRSHALFDIRVA